MKKFIPFSLFLFSIFTTQSTLANMWPLSGNIGAGWIITETWSLLQENISVEKHFLLFKTSQKNIYDKNLPYSWYDFLEKVTNISAKNIKKNSFYLRDEFWNKLKNLEHYENLFIKKVQEYSSTGSIDITAQYHFKNNSEKEIKNEKVFFSFWGAEHARWALYELNYDENIKEVKQIYILNNENDYPKNFKVIEKNKTLLLKNEYRLQKLASYWYIEEDYGYPIPVHSVDKISTFSLSFKPYEEKIITVTYSLPLKKDYLWRYRYIDYDYAPLLNWKNEKVKKSGIAVIGDKNNILYSAQSIIDEDKYSGKKNLFLEKVWTFTHALFLQDVQKRLNNWISVKNLESRTDIWNMKFVFVNIDELNSLIQLWTYWGALPKFFHSFFENPKDFEKYYENPPKATQSPDNPEKIIIEYHWEKFEMDFLEILK